MVQIHPQNERIANEPRLVDAVEALDDQKVLRGTDPYYVQWSIEGTRYRVAPKTVKALPAGRYSCSTDSYGIYFEGKIITDSELIRFPNTVADAIISEFESFWNKKDEYEKRNEPHKRGFLLWGPPGGGKSYQKLFNHRPVQGYFGMWGSL